ncbi:hypothetical protein [Solitalea canadensis]|uniref:DUF4595 domain-containing protein n=1 Tax=Solitalea canadensis (strain ATCC 29591 / DSM 3403 / JCM 21819 / LMG 8368 / NBRC 15130 / NCIMB 12057 / USAM 9D) TaxID=929556 RepID=H8KLE8_SOLCM|nr:hypothetical protein [Solitalea canadensis]AFD08650.1 hypothetical protein Solca_3646 [Solitalea canadensis DSM 3403]
MKTYALYLLMLCFSVIGCQKDIGETEAELAAKKDKNCKCKKDRYLPLVYKNSQWDSLSFYYKDDLGNLDRIIWGRYEFRFTYNGNKEVDNIKFYSRNQLSIEYRFSYNKKEVCAFTEINYVGNEVIDYKIKRQNGRLSEIYFNYNINGASNDTAWFHYNSNNVLDHYFVGGGNDYDKASLIFSFNTNANKYWANDIKSKELLFLTGIIDIPWIYPVENDITNLSISDNRRIERESRHLSYHNTIYNPSGFPLYSHKKMEYYSDMSGTLTDSTDVNITYKKVNSNH